MNRSFSPGLNRGEIRMNRNHGIARQDVGRYFDLGRREADVHYHRDTRV